MTATHCREHDSVLRFPTRLCAITLALTLATFGWVVWNAYASYRDSDSYRSRDLRVEELRGVILHLDEVLTMSARMAAATGDSRWETRYRQFEPKLDAAIKETMALAPGDSGIAGSAQTDVANAKLVVMENQAFALVHDARVEDARAVLFSGAYEEQKGLYAGGMKTMLTDVRARVNRSLRQAKQRALLSMAGSAVLLGLSIGAWVAVIGSLRRTQSELTHRVDDRTTALTQTNQTLRAEISERRQIEAELVEARDAALQAARQKAQFLANMSHEIRTPMNGIIGMTDLALDTDLQPDQREYVTTVRESAESLTLIINDILDFSKIEAGKLMLDDVVFSVRRLLADTLKPLTVRAEQKGLELRLQVDPRLPDHFRGDPGRLRQVFVNLIGNAIKFTEKGEVVISASSGDGGLVNFEVADTGIGIPFGEQARIFAAFEQADGSTTRKYGGTGLGLAISSELIGMMGGRLWVESEVGLGSRFHMTAALPETSEIAAIAGAMRSPAEQPAPARPVARPKAPIGRGLRVLLAEDNAVNQLLAVRLMEGAGHHVTAVGDGIAAVEAFGRDAFDLILMDLQMPEMGGIEATAAIRSIEAGRGDVRVPIIALTAHAMHGDRERCLEASMDGYVTKPIRRPELFAEISRLAPVPVESAA